MRTFSSPLAALSWFVRERQRADGLRASPMEPRLPGPLGRPTSRHEDRLLLLAVIGCCLRRTPRRLRTVLLLTVADGMGAVEVAAHLGCSDRWARGLIAEGRAVLAARLRRVGIVA